MLIFLLTSSSLFCFANFLGASLVIADMIKINFFYPSATALCTSLEGGGGQVLAHGPGKSKRTLRLMAPISLALYQHCSFREPQGGGLPQETKT